MTRAPTLNASALAIKPKPRPEEAMRDFAAYMRNIHHLYHSIMSVSLPRITVHADGKVTYEHSDWTKEHLAKADELAAILRDGFPWHEYGLEQPAPLGHRGA